MDGLWKRLIAGGLLCTSIGCSHFRDKGGPKLPGSTGEPPFAMNSIDDGKKSGPVKVETLIALGNVRVQAAADDKRSTQERENLANQARISYEQALKREPKNVDACLGMARMYAVVRDREKCLEWYQRALKGNTNPGDIHYEMAKVIGGKFKDKPAAVQYLQAAVKALPDNRTYRTELGFTLAWAGRYDEGYTYLSKTMPEAKARYNLAGIMEHNGKIELAKAQLALALKAEPGHEQSKDMLAALNGTPRDIPEDAAPVQAVNHEQWSVLPMNSSAKAPTEPFEQPVIAPQTTITFPDAGPVSHDKRKSPVPPPLMTTGGWDK